MKHIFFVIIIVLSYYSCNNDFLELVPYDGISGNHIWNTEENAIKAIDGIYSTFAFDTWQIPVFYITNLSPEGCTLVRSDFGLAHSMGTTADNSWRIGEMYKYFYRPIKYANDAIAGLTNNENISSDLSNRLIGEARFWRGMSYFYLWQLFGGVVILDKPLPVEETFLPRNTAEEVKQFIIADFTDAVEKLPVSYEGKDQGRITKGAAISMLGKVLLFDENWQAASENLSKLLKSPFSYSLTENYTDNFYADKQGNSETILDLQYINLIGYGSKLDEYYGFRNHFPYGEDLASANQIGIEIYTNKDGTEIDLSTIPKEENYSDTKIYGTALTEWYQETFAEADPRLHANIILPGSTFVGKGNVESKLYWPMGNLPNADSPPAINWTFGDQAMLIIRKLVSVGEESPSYRNSPVNWPMIRYADVLLMYAEAENEINGPTSAVYETINAIRSRAGIVNLPNGLSKEKMRYNIRLERFRELAYECSSYFDVKRWKTAHTNDHFFGLNQEIYDFRYKSIFYKKVFDVNRDYLWPIPSGELDVNPQMKQNPGW